MTVATKPVRPLKSVSSHVLETRNGNLVRITEVIIVVDANGDLWRRDGSQPWEPI